VNGLTGIFAKHRLIRRRKVVFNVGYPKPKRPLSKNTRNQQRNPHADQEDNHERKAVRAWCTIRGTEAAQARARVRRLQMQIAGAAIEPPNQPRRPVTLAPSLPGVDGLCGRPRFVAVLTAR